ncbi:MULTISPECIES: chorismate mutase [unclassified Paenibacillus]|uniref:chorismate mutase n=1 Tax=unclassified Paenibacillus TaxID=185978 RepID=UPI001AEAC702|nr:MULTISPECIES: chorismate mutase [unclassified Paenibacillus]MBP1155268.1 chorismate mutase [Paenibacillus sp. PvP091]MBP1169348.1 chorismate mutase [Paenibacillus sp. PvR098]MBP2440376.1 chorismate mutase [Paenibacillus sp. PvP052]
MFVRGIRGATTVEYNEENEILSATTELLNEIIAENGIIPEEIAHVFVTVTQDLTATFPAKAIRQMEGWELVPLMCSLEIPVEGSLPKCVRLMVTVNTEKSQADIKHVFQKEAMRLRPDLSKLTKE